MQLQLQQLCNGKVSEHEHHLEIVNGNLFPFPQALSIAQLQCAAMSSCAVAYLAEAQLNGRFTVLKRLLQTKQSTCTCICTAVGL